MATPTGVSGASSASASGPCTASSAVASEMSRSRTFAPRFCATMCAQSAAMLAAFTTSMSRSSKRYTRQSSTNVPWSVRIAEYWACPGVSAPTSLHKSVPVRAGDLELTHVGYIEHPHALAHGAVLGRDPPRIADRHLVAAERHQLGAEREVDLVQRGALGGLHL